MTCNYNKAFQHVISKSYSEVSALIIRLNKECSLCGIYPIPIRVYMHDEYWCINAIYNEDVNKLAKMLTMIEFDIFM